MHFGPRAAHVLHTTVTGLASSTHHQCVAVTTILQFYSLFTLYFSLCVCVQAKAMSDNTNVVALGLFAYPVLQAADILLYK